GRAPHVAIDAVAHLSEAGCVDLHGSHLVTRRPRGDDVSGLVHGGAPPQLLKIDLILRRASAATPRFTSATSVSRQRHRQNAGPARAAVRCTSRPKRSERLSDEVVAEGSACWSGRWTPSRGCRGSWITLPGEPSRGGSSSTSSLGAISFGLAL